MIVISNLEFHLFLRLRPPSPWVEPIPPSTSPAQTGKMWPFSGQSAPATISTDTIIPVHSQDDTPVYRAIVIDFTLRFDDVLDPEKLRRALARLMEIGNWKKLGARMRVNVCILNYTGAPSSFLSRMLAS